MKSIKGSLLAAVAAVALGACAGGGGESGYIERDGMSLAGTGNPQTDAFLIKLKDRHSGNHR